MRSVNATILSELFFHSLRQVRAAFRGARPQPFAEHLLEQLGAASPRSPRDEHFADYLIGLSFMRRDPLLLRHLFFCPSMGDHMKRQDRAMRHFLLEAAVWLGYQEQALEILNELRRTSADTRDRLSILDDALKLRFGIATSTAANRTSDDWSSAILHVAPLRTLLAGRVRQMRGDLDGAIQEYELYARETRGDAPTAEEIQRLINHLRDRRATGAHVPRCPDER